MERQPVPVRAPEDSKILSSPTATIVFNPDLEDGEPVAKVCGFQEILDGALEDLADLEVSSK